MRSTRLLSLAILLAPLTSALVIDTSTLTPRNTSLAPTEYGDDSTIDDAPFDPASVDLTPIEYPQAGGSEADNERTGRPGYSGLPNLQVCGTPGPSTDLREHHVFFSQNPTSRLEGHAAADGAVGEKIIVQTHMHLVTTEDQAPYYANKAKRTDLFQNQIIVLNSAYKPSNIAFALSSQTYTIRDTWATDANSTIMKRALRRGSYRDLNIYFQTNLSSYPYTWSAGSLLLGYCTLPTKITYDDGTGNEVEYPKEDYATDGCNVLAGSMRGTPQPGAPRGYGEGKTAVHEVGHWFGLLHTFQDNTCTPGDAGDYCDDTPQQSTATSGCPTGKDSCPSSPGEDPIHNYMDYSTDACYTNFTPNQRLRMVNMFNTLRKGH